MPNLLAIESTGSLCSIALSVDGKVCIREQDGTRAHTQYMLAFIDQVAQEQEFDIAALDAIVFGAGPGSFTGVRLATAIAKSLAYAANIPVIPVSSLAAIAQTTARITQSKAPCIVLTDARMGELYIAEYNFDENGLAYPLHGDGLQAIGEVDLQDFIAKRIVGDGYSLLNKLNDLSAYEVMHIVAQAQDLLPIADQALQQNRVETALSAQAIYLRDKSSWKTVEQQNQAREHNKQGSVINQQ